MRSSFKILLLAGAMLCLPLAACGETADLGVPEIRPETPSETYPELYEPPFEPLPESPELPELFEPLPEEKREEPKKEAAYVRVLVDGLNIRTGAGTGSECLGQVQRDALLLCAGRTGDWYETRYLGRTAYVSANTRYTAIETLCAGSEAVERVIEKGLDLLGTPYVYGAVRLHDGKGRLLKNFTASAFDCSSFMQYIFYEGAGVLLDVNTRTQIKQGEKVTWENIRRGDLLFFTNASRKDKTGIERVGHVGLYLGDGYLLHTASDFARAEPLSPLRKSYFLEARRMIIS